MNKLQIPKGKIVTIYENSDINQNIMTKRGIAPGVNLVIEEDIVANISSNFQPFFGSNSNSALTIIGGVARDLGAGAGFSGQLKQFGFQIWTNSEPVTFNLTFKFNYGSTGAYNAFSEVYKPIIELSKLSLPREPQEGEGLLGTLIPPGPSLLSLFSENKFLRGKQISINIGNVYFFPNIVIKRPEPVFSSEFDTQGYPISGKVTLEISTLFNATKNMIEKQYIESNTT